MFGSDALVSNSFAICFKCDGRSSPFIGRSSGVMDVEEVHPKQWFKNMLFHRYIDFAFKLHDLIYRVC